MTDVPVVLGINRINARIRRREWFRRLPRTPSRYRLSS